MNIKMQLVKTNKKNKKVQIKTHEQKIKEAFKAIKEDIRVITRNVQIGFAILAIFVFLK